MDDRSAVLRVLRAAREVSHAASHVADVAAEIARRGHDPAAADEATEMALRTARAALTVDDALRRPPSEEWIKLALDSLEQTERALRVARHMLEQTLPQAHASG